MEPYEVFFFSSVFFLCGVFLKSIGFSSFILFLTLISIGVFLFLSKTKKDNKFAWAAALSLFILVGSVYYTVDHLNFKKTNIPGEDQNFLGVVINNPTIRDRHQEFSIKLMDPFNGNLLVKAGLYPSYEYGNLLNINGYIEIPEDTGYRKYLESRGISGVVGFPEINFKSKDNGLFVKSALFKIRNRVYDSFKKTLAPTQAAFINGLTLGGYSGMTDEFKEAMKGSGTTHLVALSGYNISILIFIVLAALSFFFKGRSSVIITVLFIIAFVLMTGAESSVVRAAIMGSLILIARESGKFYDLKNALAFTALVMVLFNPKILVFDVGFQLSFLAVLGIIYLRPVIEKILKVKETPGFLSWRDNLLTTASAQLMVIPVLVMNFGSFSSISLITNVIILELIPITMALGFLIGLFSFFSYAISTIIAWFVSILLSFEIGIIYFFSNINISFGFNMGWFGVIIYYALISFLIFFINKKSTHGIV